MTGTHEDLHVVVTMPAYNAEHTIERTLKDLPPALQENVILVDDASPDETAITARRLGIEVIRHPDNRGYGGNQKTCYTAALDGGADIVVMLHPDYQYDPKAVPLLIAPLLSGGADMTFGSRFAGLSDPRSGGMPRYRYIGNRLTTIAQNFLYGTHFTEMHSGMRAYTADFLRAVDFHSFQDGFEFDSEMMAAAISGNFRVVEVPIPTRYTEESSSIAIGPSLRYVAHAVATAARTRLRSGGKRHRRGSLGVNMAAEVGAARCVLCGGADFNLVHPATADGEVPVSEFACTTSAVSVHDDIVECRRCGLRASVPTLEPHEIIDNYEQVVDDEYLSQEAARRETFGWMLARIEAAGPPARTVLEFGSNVGLFLAVAEERGWRARGVEPSRWAVHQGVDRFGVDLVAGTVEAYPTDEPAPVVAMFDVLEHVNDPVAVLDQVAKLVEPGGLLALSTVDTDSLHSRVRGPQWPWYIRSHLFYFTRRTLGRMVTEAGFDIVDWVDVPRSFRLSYILHKGGWEDSLAGRVAAPFLRVVDPRIPAGWLGDIKLVVARRVP